MNPPSLSKPIITLDRDTHTYFRDGVKIDAPSITDVCGMYGRNYQGIDPFYAERGTAVHLGLELINRDVIDWETVDHEIEGFLRSYDKFVQSGVEPVLWEVPLYSERLCFTGTFDLIFKGKDGLILADAKTSKSVDPVVELQLDGQQILIYENTPYKPDACAYLQLLADGAIAKLVYVETGDFLSALEIFRWKMSHTRKKK